MTTHVDKYNQPGSTNVLVPLSEESFGDLKTKDQTYLRKDSIKDAIIPFDYQVWSSTHSPSMRPARGRTIDWSFQHIHLCEQIDLSSPTSITS